MLVDVLLSYLSRVVPDAKLTTYKDYLPFLYQLDPGTFEVQFNQFCTYKDDFNTVDNIAQFDSTVFVLLCEAVEEFGVYLSDSAPIIDQLPLIGKMAKGLYLIDQYEDLLAIKYLYDTAENNREFIADLLHTVDNTIDPSSVLEVVEDVSPAIIIRVREYLADLEYHFESDGTPTDIKTIERVKNAITIFGIDRAIRYFREGGRIGEDLENYLDYFLSGTETTPADTIAKLSVFSAIASGIASSQIKEILSELLPNYFNDTQRLMSVSRAVLSLKLPE